MVRAARGRPRALARRLSDCRRRRARLVVVDFAPSPTASCLIRDRRAQETLLLLLCAELGPWRSASAPPSALPLPCSQVFARGRRRAGSQPAPQPLQLRSRPAAPAPPGAAGRKISRCGCRRAPASAAFAAPLPPRAGERSALIALLQTGAKARGTWLYSSTLLGERPGASHMGHNVPPAAAQGSARRALD